MAFLFAAGVVGAGYSAWREDKKARDRAKWEEINRRIAAEKEANLQRSLRELGIPPDLDLSEADIAAARLDVGYQNGMANIVFVGDRGAGKSTLINCVRGLEPWAEGVATVGEVNTTIGRHRYDDLVGKGISIMLFDTEGAGIVGSSAWRYYYDKKLYAFDVVVLVHQSTLSESDVRIRRICHHRGQKCILVRTKADQHIRNINRRTRLPIAAAREDYMRQVQEDMAHFNAIDEARAPGELRVEIVDYVVNEMAVLWKVTQVLAPDPPAELPDDEFSLLINEGAFLADLGLLREG